MTLGPGSRFGAYEVLALLGVGGMGEVYRARDAKLNRDVALKILPEIFARDADRRARFEREAQILASLSHPAIGAIYGIEETAATNADDRPRMGALVLELIEGPTLADEIAGGRISVDQALDIARQIAEALEAAHQKGVVHRDLKPANVKVRPDGLVKVLDFGLAKALEQPSAPPSAGHALVSPALTEVGVLFGTAAYMSPEQARGRAADNRSDIWSFGCVLYEMLVGKRPFEGEETSDVLAAILRAEPDWNALPADTPVTIRRLLRRCLAKDRARRLRDIGDAKLEIEEARLTPDSPQAAPSAKRRGERGMWSVGVAVAVLAALGVGRWIAPAEAPAPEMRLDVGGGETPSPESFALSPDGRSIVFNAVGERGPQLWVRELASSAAKPLPGTEDGQYPFWSPDSRSIGFFTPTVLKRVDVDGGRPQTLATTVTPAGGSWNADGTIVYVPNNSGGVFSVSATGGESRLVTPRTTSTLATRYPQFLPDGRNFLFYVAREDESGGIFLGNLDSGEIRRLVGADTAAVYAAGHVWFANEGALFAQPFDTTTLELGARVVRVEEAVDEEPRIAALSASAAGPIAYRRTRATRELSWFDRAGRRLSSISASGDTLGSPSLSPDGRQLLVQQTVSQNLDVWLIEDLQRPLFRRLTLGPGIDSMPVWAPDGRRFVYNGAGRAVENQAANPGGQAREGMIAIARVDGSSVEQPLVPFASNDIKIASDWSPDGKVVLLKQLDPRTGTWDVWAVPVDDPANPLRLTPTDYDERNAEFAPDGQSIAFESNESGEWEIYVQPFPGSGGKRRVSTNGGHQVRWRRDGAELFYVALDGRLMAVPVAGVDGRLEFGAPVALFETRLPPRTGISRQQYVVSADGERFLLVTSADDTAPITLLLNWRAAAQR
jgi:serine/threonine protein kinase